MAKSTLPTNYKDDIMNSSMGGKRRYNVIQNTDGTISLEDATTYDQVGSNFGAGNINAINIAINASADASKIIDDVDTINALTQSGYIAGGLALKKVSDSLTVPDGTKYYADKQNGKYGVNTDPNRGADTFIPFKGEITSGEAWCESMKHYYATYGGSTWHRNMDFTNIKSFTIALVNPQSYTGYRHYIKFYDSNGTEIKDITITTTPVTFSDADIFTKANKIYLYYPNATDYSFAYETK